MRPSTIEGLNYLGRYLFRVAISNYRIESMDHGQVRFRYGDNKTRQLRTLTLPAVQFISRFLQHVLPRRFHKVRYYGIFSPTASDRLERVRASLAALQQSPGETPDHDHAASMSPAISQSHALPWHPCPFCQQGIMRIIPTIRRMRGPPWQAFRHILRAAPWSDSRRFRVKGLDSARTGRLSYH